MKSIRFDSSERIANGYTHCFVVTHDDLTVATNATAQTINLTSVDLAVGDVVLDVLLDVKTAFAQGTNGGTPYSGAVNANVGVTGAATQFLGNSDIRSAVPYAPANTFAPYATATTGKKIILTVTPGAGENLDAGSAGEFHIYVKISRVADRPVVAIS